MSSPSSRRYTAEEIAKLKALAEAATPGPWVVEDDEIQTASQGSGVSRSHVVCFGHDYDDYGYANEEDLAFIAALSPDVVLNLLRSAAEDALRLEQIEHWAHSSDGAIPEACSIMCKQFVRKMLSP